MRGMALCGAGSQRCSSIWCSNASPAGRPVVEAYDWLRDNLHRTKPSQDAPQGVIGNAWQRYVLRKDGSVDIHAYTFCMLNRLAAAIQRRDVFTKPSWRYADPRANLLNESEWEAMRPVVSRSLVASAAARSRSADQRTRQNLSRGCTTAIEQPRRSIRNRQRQGRKGRHSLARAVFHGKRGELRQHYREGQEDQLGALGLVVNMIVLWNTMYMEAAIQQLRKDGYTVRDEDMARLSPLVYGHIQYAGSLLLRNA